MTIPINGLLSVEGIRFIFTSFVPNFAGFGVVAVTFVALMGAGVAEASGLMARAHPPAGRGVAASAARVHPHLRRRALERRLGRGLPDPGPARARRRSRASGGTRWPGMAACFAGVGAIFAVNPILGPIDAMITEITNEALGRDGRGAADHRRQLVLQHRVVDRAGRRRRDRHRAHRRAAAGRVPAGSGRRGRPAISIEDDADAVARPGGREARACATPCSASSGSWPSSCVFTLPDGAPLRDPETGDIIGTTPFMDSLLFIIAMFFLVAGIGYGYGRRDVQAARTTSSRP